MSTGESVLLCKESAPVLRLLLPKTDTAHLWTATTNPQIKKWVNVFSNISSMSVTNNMAKLNYQAGGTGAGRDWGEDGTNSFGEALCYAAFAVNFSFKSSCKHRFLPCTDAGPSFYHTRYSFTMLSQLEKYIDHISQLGRPGIIRSQILNDRMRILTQVSLHFLIFL